MTHKIVFMGSPFFAVRMLDALTTRYEVVGVVTQPDKPAGRGRNLTPPPVKEFAMSKGIPVIQPARLKEPGVLEQLMDWGPLPLGRSCARTYWIYLNLVVSTSMPPFYHVGAAQHRYRPPSCTGTRVLGSASCVWMPESIRDLCYCRTKFPSRAMRPRRLSR